MTAQEQPPALDPMDVTWPDGTFKVFPDRTEQTFTAAAWVQEPEARNIWGRIMDEVHARRLEESILEELSAVITERGTDAPGLLIIHTPDGQWAMRESEWLAPGCAVLSRMDHPDLMAMAQGEGWLYYRQTTGTMPDGWPPAQEPESIPVQVISWEPETGLMEFTVDDQTAAMLHGAQPRGLSISMWPDEVHVDLVPDLGEYGRQVTQNIVDGLEAPIPDRMERRRLEREERRGDRTRRPVTAPAVCPDCGFDWPEHRFGCINE